MSKIRWIGITIGLMLLLVFRVIVKQANPMFLELFVADQGDYTIRDSYCVNKSQLRLNLANNAPQKEPLCVIIKGEIFRFGGQNSRNTVQGNVTDQNLACNSLLEHLITPFSEWWEMKIVVDVFSGGDIDRVMQCFAGIDVDCFRIRTRPETQQTGGIMKSLEWAKYNIPSCRSAFVIRADILLKQDIPVLKPNSVRNTNVIVPWRVSKVFGNTLPSGKPRVADTFFLFPDMAEMITILHKYRYAWDLHNIADWVSSFDYFVKDICYDTDSSKEYNDFYRMSGRPEALKIITSC